MHVNVGGFLPMKNKERISFFYEVFFAALALVAVFLSFRDISTGLTVFQYRIDFIINIIFIIDYGIRFLSADKKKDFFKNNILDLVAIIPFTSLFKVFRVFKIFKFLRLLKFARISAYFVRFYKRIRFFFDVNGFKYMVLVTVSCIITGGVAIHYAEGMSFSDGLWWSFVTATTVGYGDISPSTIPGRVIASFLMIVGIGLIGSLTSTITAVFFQRSSDKQSRNAKDSLISSIQSQLDNFDELTDDDVHTICCTLQCLHDSNRKDAKNESRNEKTQCQEKH